MEATGYGQTLAYGSVPTTFGTITEITDTPEAVPPEVNTSGSSDAAVVTQPSKRVDYGKLAGKLKYRKSDAALIQGWVNNGTVQNFTYTVTDGTITSAMSFNGWVRKLKPLGSTVTPDKFIESELEIRLSSAWTTV